MPIFNNLPTKKGSTNIEEIAAVKLCLPFTTDLLNHSIYEAPITNTGATLGSEGAVFNGASSNLQLPFKFGSSENDTTFEFILKIPQTISSVSFLCNGNIAYNFGIELRTDNKLYVGSAGADISTKVALDIVEFLGKDVHIAVVTNKLYVKIYINGVFKLSGHSTYTYTYGNLLLIGNSYGKDAVYKDTIGGFKITNKALEPSQFSMTRPFKPLLPNFKVGTRTYIYDNGLWNPTFDKQVSAGVVFEQDRIKIPQSNNIDISTGDFSGKTIVMEFFATLIAGGISNGSLCYISLIDAASVVRKVVYNLTSNNESINVVRTMGIKYSDGLPKTRIKSENNQLIYISRIWIED